MPNVIKSSCNSQRGSSMLLAVVAVLVGLMAIWLLAWIPLVERSGRSEINLLTNRICDIVASKAPLTRVMWEMFTDELEKASFPENLESGKELRYSEIVEAKLFIGGPSNTIGDFLNGPAPGVDWRNHPSFSEYEVFGSPDPVVRRSINNPNSDHSILVEFHNTFKNAPVSPFVVNDIRNFGNTAVCVIKAKAKDSIIGIPKNWVTRENDETFEIVSGSWNPVQGVNSIPPLPAPSEDILEYNSNPGVILAIAPQMPELDLAGRHVFITEPLLNLDSRFMLTDEVKASLPMVTSRSFIERANQGQEKIQGAMRIIPPIELFGANRITDPQVTERLIGCANPLALARAAFTSALTELMSRHGQLRKGTEILLVNGRHFDSTGTTPFDNEQWAPPAIIVPAGSDLTSPVYQLPYVTMQDFTGGWSAILEPEARSPESINWKSLLAGQLTHCAHIYANARGGKAFDSPINGDAYSGFEPSELYTSLQYLDTNPLVWQRNFLQHFAIPLMPAFQVIAQIGSTRTCPVHHISLAPPCDNLTSDPSRNLYLPDLDALSHFTSPTSNLGLGVTQRNFAIQKPGALLDSGVIDNSDFTLQPIENPKNQINYNYPMQILVLHTLNEQIVEMLGNWRDSGRMNRLYGRSDASEWGDVRPFRLVLIPSVPIEIALMESLANRLGVEVTGPKAGLNRIVIIEPCEVDEHGEKLYPDFCSNPEHPDEAYKGENIRNFWNSLIFDRDLKHNIYKRAEEFFKLHVVTTSRIL